MEVIRAGKEWKEQIIAFADQVFGEDVQPGGFAALIPDVYGERADCDGNHLLVLEDGEIQALVLMEPMVYVCGQERLRFLGVGTVSVAEKARGRGYMQLLLRKVEEEIEKEGYAFAVLSGQRQRYGYWGYEPAGLRFQGQIRPENVKHALGKERTGGMEKGISFAPLKEGGDDERQAFELFQSEPFHTLRTAERFALHLQAERARGLAILLDGKFAGYLSVSCRRGGTAITELGLADDGLFPAVLKAFFESRAREGFSVRLPLHHRKRLALVEEICDWYTLQNDHQYRIADLAGTLEFFLKGKLASCGLTEGCWDFRTQEALYRCQVKGKTASVVRKRKEEVDSREWERAFTDTYPRLIRLLFSPLTMLAGPLCGAPADWFPLPLYLPDADAV